MPERMAKGPPPPDHTAQVTWIVRLTSPEDKGQGPGRGRESERERERDREGEREYERDRRTEETHDTC